MSETRIALIAALPREVAALVSGWTRHREQEARGIFIWSRSDVVVAAAGMGAARASLAVEAALAHGSPQLLVSTGVAGGCDPAIANGTVLEAGEVIDTLTGERFRTAAQAASATVVTTAHVVGVREKRRLHEAYAAQAVEMEAATVARLALAHGIPFRAIKAVSDAHDFELPALLANARFVTRHGHFHTGAFARYTALRPHTWRQTVKLGRHSAQAIAALHKVLRSDLLN